MWTLKSKGRHPKNKGYPTILGYPKIDDGPLPGKGLPNVRFYVLAHQFCNE